MLTKTAQIDLEELRANGYQPTDADVVALNDLAIRIERGENTTPANHPRIAFAGSTVLHEPTIGALEWWMDYGRDAAFTTKGRMETYFFMFANARRVDWLQTLTNAKDIRKAVRKWKQHVDATEEELWRATFWCRFGTNDPPDMDGSEDDGDMRDNLWDIVMSAAAALQTTPSQLKTETQSTLLDAVYRVNLRARMPMKQSIAKDYMAYRRLLHNIEARGKTDGKQ